MDTTRQDGDETRKWYVAARDLGEKYCVSRYPSYLFFSPDGKIVHKEMGAKNIDEFLFVARAAMDSRQQYYTLLAGYREKSLSYSLMPVLVKAAQNVAEYGIARQVCKDYIRLYLEKLATDKLWNNENIGFIEDHSFFIDIGDSIFQLYYHYRSSIDSVMHQPHFSDEFIGKILYKGEIKPCIDKALRGTDEPEWRHMEKSMEKNFASLYVNKDIIRGKAEYYKAKRKWQTYIKYFVLAQKIDSLENKDANEIAVRILLNNAAYEVFKYSENKRELRRALFWVNRALAASDKPNPQIMDTKANLLYKLGERNEGLSLEKESYVLSPTARDISNKYEKMKKNLPTWSTE